MIELPWPDMRILSPNRKKHWAVKHKAKKKLRADCKILSGQCPEIKDGYIQFNVYFHPPTAHKRDLDNVIASFKAGFDGMADAWGVDDSIFAPRYFLKDPVKGGKVIIETL